MENLLLDLLSEVVAHSPDEHALRERRDFRRRNKTVELGIYRRRGIAAVDAHGLSLLHDLSESFGERPGRFSYDLSAEDIAHGILNHGGFLVSVVAL